MSVIDLRDGVEGKWGDTRKPVGSMPMDHHHVNNPLPQWGPRPSPPAGEEPGKSVAPRPRASGCLIGFTIVTLAFGLQLIQVTLSPIRLLGVLLVGSGIVGTATLALQRHRRQATERSRREALKDYWLSLPEHQLASSTEPLAYLSQLSHRHRGGIFLGIKADDRRWMTAEPEQAILVLGPPRSGKTSAVIIPAILSAPGAVVSTSTKLDVFAATAATRTLRGTVWVYDPTGREALPPGAVRLRWSPVTAAATWDEALVTGRAMIVRSQVGLQSAESAYWEERAGTLLAALLHAANLRGLGIAEVRRWILRHDLLQAQGVLQEAGVDLAADVLEGVARSPARTIGSVFSTASSSISAYNSQSALEACRNVNFDVDLFVSRQDTIYISAAGQTQDLLAPLIVGLVESIRHATYRRARRLGRDVNRAPTLLALDEVANIAPIKSLPEIASEGGSQGLALMACFQDLAQARSIWGEAAKGFLSLFGTKIIFPGIADVETLRSLSVSTGTWERPYASFTRGQTVDEYGNITWQSSASHSTRREPLLTEGDISRLPQGYSLAMSPAGWALIEATPFFHSRAWQNVITYSVRSVAAGPPRRG
jgi:type IV secretion system protein VirD4